MLLRDKGEKETGISLLDAAVDLCQRKTKNEGTANRIRRLLGMRPRYSEAERQRVAVEVFGIRFLG